MSRPIRVLFDITFLGRAEADPQRMSMRAGLFRMIEQVVPALAAEPSVHLTLGSQTHVLPAHAFASRHPDMRALAFATPARTRLATRLREEAVDEHLRGGGRMTAAIPKRVASRVAGDVNRVLDTISHASGGTAIARTDVFHSPFHALPPRDERARHVRYFLTVHDLIPFVCRQPGSHDWLREILDSIGPDDRILTDSEHTRRDVLEFFPGMAPERVSVALLAADTSRFYPCRADPERIARVRTRYGIPDAPYVLSVGTLFPHKNIPRLIRAFAEVVRAERLDDLNLVLTGARERGYEAILAELDRHDHVADRVLFTGYVDDEDLAPLYSGALAFAFPSYYEGFGLPPLEAMQCGTPVVAGSASSVPEVVGDAGILVDPMDVDAFAQGRLDGYRDDARRAELARRGLARAREFTWARHAAQTVAAYRAAL